ncbi:MAG: DUF533 domain-containing protein [Pseudomonadota bacterium]
MTDVRDRAILSIALFAAFADGDKHEQEREEIRRIADLLTDQSSGPDLRALYQDVLLKKTTLADTAALLNDAGEKHLAYEMAVGVCDADGRLSDAERAFLDQLKGLMAMDADESNEIEQAAEQVVAMTEAAAPAIISTGAVAAEPTAAKSALPSTAAHPQVDEVELDQSILKYSILNGALELLPQSWASMAIIPLQIKMVYRIGQRYGVELDQGHIREFIAAAGVGLTSQYFEQFGRKLLGGLLRRAAGKSIGKMGRAATGMAFSFATTYALGQLAKRYYAGGRQMSTQLLRDTFQNLLTPAKQMQTKYLPQIEQQAQTLDMGQVMNMVRGKESV